MNLGFHVSLTTPEWTSPFLDAIDRAAKLGCTCVEIPLMDPASFPLEEVRRRIDRSGMRVYCGTGLGLDSDIGSSSSMTRERGLAHLQACLNICASLGSDSLGGVIHSPWGRREPADSAYTGRVVSSLAAVADMAGDSGISLALECINRYESSFLNTVDQGLELLDEIGRHNVALHLDTYHMNIEETDPVAALTRAQGRIGRLHLSENTRGYPGSGALPWKRIIETAKEAGYCGPWIIESYVNPEFPAAKDVCVWRKIEPDMNESLHASLTYIAGLVAEVSEHGAGS